MSSTYGENLKLSIFGQSHGPAIGMTLDGIPAGLKVDLDRLQTFLNRRAPGQNAYSTTRKEADKPEFLSGLHCGFTCGAPIAAIIVNTNTRSGDYDSLLDIPRPGHADFTAQMKYGGFQDVAGGGHFSGRLTAPLCIAGGLCKQWLEEEGVRIGAHILSIGEEKGQRFDPVCPELDTVREDFPVFTPEESQRFQDAILDAKQKGDSLGGRIECAVTGLPAGLGDPMFGGMENRLAQILFGIPAVKNVGFGASEEFAAMTGSQSNDAYTVKDGTVRTRTNHCGGILGGITNGMPLIFDVTVRATPSIAQAQESVSLRQMSQAVLEIHGRHDPCIVPRAVPVVEAAAAIAVFDALLARKRETGRACHGN